MMTLKKFSKPVAKRVEMFIFFGSSLNSREEICFMRKKVQNYPTA